MVNFLPRFGLAALTAATLAVAPLSASAFAVFDDDQDLEIQANGFAQVLFYDFETDESRLSNVGFGDFEVEYFLNFREDNSYDFIGAFLFDYSQGEFTAAFFAAADNSLNNQ